MTRKQQLINEIADLIVERLDERSRLDELSPKFLKGVQKRVGNSVYDWRAQKIRGNVKQHYAVWFKREVLEPMVSILQKELQTLSSEKVAVKLGHQIEFYENHSGNPPFFKGHFIASRGDKTEGFYPHFHTGKDGFDSVGVGSLEETLTTIITFVIREGVERWDRNIQPLTREEIKVIDKIISSTRKILDKPDIVDGAKELNDLTRTRN